jgi:hypothetical protein
MFGKKRIRPAERYEAGEAGDFPDSKDDAPPPVQTEGEELRRLREENARLRERLGMGAGE